MYEGAVDNLLIGNAGILIWLRGLKFLLVGDAAHVVEYLHFPGTDRHDQAATETLGQWQRCGIRPEIMGIFDKTFYLAMISALSLRDNIPETKTRNSPLPRNDELKNSD